MTGKTRFIKKLQNEEVTPKYFLIAETLFYKNMFRFFFIKLFFLKIETIQFQLLILQSIDQAQLVIQETGTLQNY